jgi:hypothetical protein
MSSHNRYPRLRIAEKIAPPYPLGKFPSGMALAVGRQVIYLLATKQVPTLEGAEWEKIFANAIGAEWKPSNIGLDDVILGNTAFGAKTVKANNPFNKKRVRLISGRNSPVFSYGSTIDTNHPPEEVGEKVVEIWNARVDLVRAKHAHVRTVVLIKSNDLLKLTIFETETVRYNPSLYEWKWNPRGNLEGWRNDKHCFTWQPHGSQFTIIEDVPDSKLCIQLRAPGLLNEDAVLQSLGFDESWVQVVKSN